MVKYCCQFDLDYVLNAPAEEAGRMLKDAQTGRTLTSAEAKAHAAILKAQGYEVLPIGCDNYDAKGYCSGHES